MSYASMAWGMRVINEYIRYRIPSNRHKDFVADYARAGKFLRASPVCHGYDLSRCEEDPECFILRIVWTSTQDHLSKFRGSEEFKGFLAAIKSYVPSIEEMRHYEPSEVQWTR